MIARRRSAGPVAGVLLSCLVSSCAGHRVPEPARVAPPAQIANARALLGRLEERSATTAWTARAKLELIELQTRKSRGVDVRIAGRKPADIRMQGTKTLLPTLFVLVANSGGVWLDVPSRKTTYTLPAGAAPGPVEGLAHSLLAFNTRDLLRGLVPDPPAEDELWSIREEPWHYTLSASRRTPESTSGTDLRPTRDLVFERRHLSLTEQRLYDESGRLVSRTRFQGAVGEAPLPPSVHLERPFDGYEFRFQFDDARPSDLKDTVFTFSPALGRDLIDISESDVDLTDVVPPEGAP